MKKLFMCLSVLTFLLFPNLVSAKEKVNVYIFRGDGCPHCENALEFLNGLEESEKEKFNLIQYEVWNDSKNKTLMTKVANKLGETTTSVPYIIIGKKSFNGYDEEIGKSILEEIDSMYESQKMVDIVSSFTKRTKSDTVAVITFVVCVGAVIGFIVLARNRM